MDDCVANQRVWNELAALHAQILHDGEEVVRTPQGTLRHVELGLVGSFQSKRVLHLACHLGHDTVSMARLGAQAHGVDLSPVATEHAANLASTIGASATFSEADLSAPLHLSKEFDLVIATYGVLEWINDLDQFARNCRSHLKQSGDLVVVDCHPFKHLLRDDPYETGTATVRYRGFDPICIKERTPMIGSYLDRGTQLNHRTSARWFWSISQILMAFRHAGFQCMTFNEHAFSHYQKYPWLERHDDGYWHTPSDMPALPLLASWKFKPSAAWVQG